ncbi:hypothetical protein M436DRAFT_66104 [Aureobasidium namibiae CBS 147.97]|uniref:Uncharacterized protein n=1 Tax=Aureobasidium namibiae CBS 147.97 TaxID=1043004 RepID=A0A074WGG2_9PEZI|nr:uncharacterized protein M436DRAFT_66104 [Aureobasidium namibiae CBS 147.97]KEQ70699.1 hypothetical protein M436DRAFT_66104 [Aureobasidium namibiae CBS 147.97]
MSIHTSFFCVGLMFDEHGVCQTVAEQCNDHTNLVAWLKNTAILKKKVNGQRSWEDKRRWTHRILIVIRSTTRSPTSCRFVDKTLTRRPVSLDTHNLLWYVFIFHVNLTPADEMASVALLRAEIQEPADAPPIPFFWQTAIWKQHRLSASVIDCSDFRFAILNSSLEHQIQHLYDYRALPFLILQIYIEELLSSIGRAKMSEYRIEPPPTVIEKYNHHINLKRQCLAYIPFLCWLIDFDVLADTVFACEACLRSCLLHDTPIIQATLIYADQELAHLNQLLHFQLCCHHPHLPPPSPPAPKPPTPKPPTPKPATPKPPHNPCCNHCTHPNHPNHLPHLSLTLVLPLILSLLLLIPLLLVALYIRHNWKLTWLFYIFSLAFLCHLFIRHYIHSSLEHTRNNISAWVTETRKAIVAALILITVFLQC